ncbi:MAG: hypothetical protein ACLRQF_00890 [Thomasclavelia ramosa]
MVSEIDNLKRETVRRGQDQELSLKIGYLRCYGLKNYIMQSLNLAKHILRYHYQLLMELGGEMIFTSTVDLVISINDEHLMMIITIELLYSDCYIEIQVGIH